MIPGWEYKTVGQIADHSLGKMLDKAKNRGALKPYLRNFNVRWFEFDLTDLLSMPFETDEAERYTAVKGDVLVCEGGYPGRAAIWQEDSPIYFQKALHRVRFHEPERNRWFLYYLYAKDIDGTLKQQFNGAGIQHFTGETLAQFQVPLPPLAQQRRIVATLDQAFESIAIAKANAEKNLENARSVFESELESLLARPLAGSKPTLLGDEVELLAGFAFRSARYSTAESDVRLLRGDNIIPGALRWDDVKRWPIDDTLDYAQYSLQVGDVVVAMDRPWVKAGLKHAMVTDLDLPALLVQRTARLRPKAGLDNRFLLYLIGSSEFTRHILGIQTGIGVPHISGQQIKDFQFSKPALVAQRRIVTTLDRLRADTIALQAIYERKLAALDELKKSLLHQAFTGQL